MTCLFRLPMVADYFGVAMRVNAWKFYQVGFLFVASFKLRRPDTP